MSDSLAVFDRNTGEARLVALEEENRLLRRRLALACGAAGVGIWEYDFLTRSLWVSDELASIYGLSAHELTWPEFASRIHPDDVVAGLLEPTPSFPLGEVNEFLLRIRHEDGGFRTVRSRSVTFGDDGVPAKKVGVHIDMSEDALLHLTEDLAEANERLRSFAYVASHDLRSPLRGLGQILSIVLEDGGEDLPTPAVGLLRKAEERVEKMVRLIRELQNYATGDLDHIDAAACDIDRLLHDIVGLLETTDLAVTVQSGFAGSCDVAVSPLTTCVQNLVDNACKHHDRVNGNVTVSAECDGSWLTIAVTDDGPGIPESEQAKIFDPFYTTDPSNGTGLGLAYVARTAKKYLATLTCESEVGQGTTFTLRWPV